MVPVTESGDEVERKNISISRLQEIKRSGLFCVPECNLILTKYSRGETGFIFLELLLKKLNR